MSAPKITDNISPRIEEILSCVPDKSKCQALPDLKNFISDSDFINTSLHNLYPCKQSIPTLRKSKLKPKTWVTSFCLSEPPRLALGAALLTSRDRQEGQYTRAHLDGPCLDTVL